MIKISLILHRLRIILIAFALLLTTLTIQRSTSAAPSKNPLHSGHFLLMATDVKGSYDKVQLVAVDSVTLETFDWLKAILLKHHFEYAITPNRQTMAVVMWPRDSDLGAELHIIDILSWKARATGLKFDVWVQNLTFSADGKTLYWMAPGTQGGMDSLPRDFKLYRYNVGSGKVEELATLPKIYMPMNQQMRIIPKLNRMAIYALPVDERYLTQEHPHLVMVDLEKGGITANLELTSIVDGSHKLDANKASDTSYGYDNAAVTWNIEKNLMYIAHPTLDRILIVDLATMKTSLWNLPGTETKAAGPAKMSPGMDRTAVLNNTGDRMFLSGLRRTATKRDDGGFDMANEPIGIVGLDVTTQTPIYKGDYPVSRLALSPDGKLLLAAGDRFTLKNGKENFKSSGLYILNAEDGKVIKHFTDFETNITFEGFSVDGRTAYVTAWPAIGSSGPTLRAIDLTTFNVIARKLSGPYLTLIGTRRE